MDAHASLVGLVHLLKSELIVILGALAGIVAYQMMNGAINLKGIFSKDEGQFDPARVQLLFSTLIVAGGYLSHPSQISSGSDASLGAGALMGGSNLIYLINKIRMSANR